MATTTTLQNIYKVTKEQYESIVAGTFEGHEYDENALYLVEDDGQIDLSSCLQVTRLEADVSEYDALNEIIAKYRGKSGYYLAEYNDNYGDEKAPLLILYSADPDLIEEHVILHHPQGNVESYVFNAETSEWEEEADLAIAYTEANSAIQELSLENNEIKYWTWEGGWKSWQSTGIVIPTKTSLGLDKVNNVAITDAQVEQIGKNADAISKLHNYDDTELRGLIDKKVDNTTTINSKPLTSNITLEKSDIGLGNVNNVAITDDQVTQIGTNKSDIDTLKTKVSNLTGAFTFQGSLGDNEDLPAATADNKGYVYIKGHKEYVSDGTKWVELGDEGSFVLKTTYESHLNEQKAKDDAQDAAIGGKVNTSDYTKDQATQAAKDKAQDEAIAAIKVPTTVAELTDAGDYAKKADLFSKDYNDLTNKPTLFSGNYNDLTDKPIFGLTLDKSEDETSNGDFIRAAIQYLKNSDSITLTSDSQYSFVLNNNLVKILIIDYNEDSQKFYWTIYDIDWGRVIKGLDSVSETTSDEEIDSSTKREPLFDAIQGYDLGYVDTIEDALISCEENFGEHGLYRASIDELDYGAPVLLNYSYDTDYERMSCAIFTSSEIIYYHQDTDTYKWEQTSDRYATKNFVMNTLDNYATHDDLVNAMSEYVLEENLEQVAKTGSYNDLKDKPTIPTSTSQLTNDSGFLTQHQSLENYVDKTSDQTIGGAKTFNTRPILPLSEVSPTQAVNQYFNTPVGTQDKSGVHMQQQGSDIVFSGTSNGYMTFRISIQQTIPVGHVAFAVFKYSNPNTANDFGVRLRSNSTNLSYAGKDTYIKVGPITDPIEFVEFYGGPNVSYDNVRVHQMEVYDLTEIYGGNENIPADFSNATLDGLTVNNRQSVIVNDLIKYATKAEVLSITDLGQYSLTGYNIVNWLDQFITKDHKTQSGYYRLVDSFYNANKEYLIQYTYSANHSYYGEYAQAIVIAGDNIKTCSWTPDGGWVEVLSLGEASDQAKAAFKDASVNGNTLTFTKNDGTTKDVTLPAGGESSGPLKIKQLTSASIEDGLNEIHDYYYDTNGYYLTTNDNLIRYERNKIDDNNDELIATVWENDGVVVYKWVKDGVIEVTDKVWTGGGMYFHSGDDNNYVSFANPFEWNDNILQSSLKFSGDIQMAYYYGAPWNYPLFAFSNIYWGHDNTPLNELTKLEKELPPEGLTYLYVGFKTDLTIFQGTKDGEPTINYSEVVYKDGWVKQNPTVTKTYTLSGDSGTYRFAQLIDVNDMSRGECSVLCYGEIDGERTRLSNSVFTFTCGLNPDTLKPMADVLSTSQTPEISGGGSGSSGGDAEEDSSTAAVNNPSYGVDSVRFERHGKNVYAMLNILVGYQARYDNLIVEVKMTNSHNVELLDFMENVPDIVLSDEFSLLNGLEFKGYQDYSIKLKGPINDLYTLASKDEIQMGWLINPDNEGQEIELRMLRRTQPSYMGGGVTWEYVVRTPNNQTGTSISPYFIKLDDYNDPIYKSSHHLDSDHYALYSYDIENMFFDYSSNLGFKVTDLYVSLSTDIPGAQIYAGYEPIVMDIPIKINSIEDKFFLMAENEYGDLESIEGDIYVSLDLEQTRFQISVLYRNEVPCTVEDFEIYSTDYYNTQIFIEEVDKHYTSDDYTLFSVYDFRYDTLRRLDNLECFRENGTIPIHNVYSIQKGMTEVLEYLTSHFLSNWVDTHIVCVNGTNQYLYTWEERGYPGSWCYFEGLRILSLNNFDSYGVWQLTDGYSSDLTINGYIRPSNKQSSYLIIDKSDGEWKIRGSNVLYHQTKEGKYIFDLTQSDKQDTDVISEIMTQLYNHGLNYRYHYGQEFSGSILVRNPIDTAPEGSSGGSMILDEYYIDCHTSFKNIDNWEFEYTCEFTKDNVTYIYTSTIEDFESIISDWTSMSDYFAEYISYDDCKQSSSVSSVARSLGLSVMTKKADYSMGSMLSIDFGNNIIDWSKPVIIDLCNGYDVSARMETSFDGSLSFYCVDISGLTNSFDYGCIESSGNPNYNTADSSVAIDLQNLSVDMDVFQSLVDTIRIYYSPVNALSRTVIWEV